MDSQLPENYTFIYDNDINTHDIMSLRAKVGWNPDTELVWEKCLSESIITVGIVFEEHLVGIGFLTGNSRHAILCDLVVDPAHQGKGLGKLLLTKRVRHADEHSIKYLYTDIAETNPMREVYSNLGFTHTDGGLFRQLP